MKKIKLEPFEIQMAADVATRRFVENLKMNRGFGHGFKGTIDKQIALGISGACSEVAFCKAYDKYWNGSYSHEYKEYTDTDISDNIEIRSQYKKPENYLIIRPNDKKAKFVLVIDESPNFSIMGWYLNNGNINEKYLTNFGIQSRPYCYGIPLSDLYNMEELCQTK